MERTKNPLENEEEKPKMWFDHMHGYLTWKVYGPDIHNPFSREIPFRQLQRMATEWDFLNQYVHVRCLCDGYEVMTLINPLAPRIMSSHPCVSSMNRDEIVDYMKLTKIFESIAFEAQRIQDEIRDHLKIREEKHDEENKDTGIIKNSKRDERRKPAGQGGSGMAYRIVKR